MIGMPGEATKADVAVTTVTASRDDSSSSIVDIRRIITFIGATYFFLMTIWVVPVGCVCTVALLYPLIFINKKLFINLENKLCAMVNAHWSSVSHYCTVAVTEYGTNLHKYADKKCLLLANHLGLLDHFIIMQSLNDKEPVRSKWIWVIFNIWKYTPLGVMWMSHGNFFINGGVSKRQSVLDSFRDHLQNYFHKYDYGWVVMYPEGSRLYLIKDSAKTFAAKNGLEPLNHCVYPRIGAAHAVIDVLGPKADDASIARCGKGAPLEYIIDATIGYKDGVVPPLADAIMSDWPTEDASNLAIHYEVIPVKEEWQDQKKLQDFLYERYQIKDKLLEYFYKNGRFPGRGERLSGNPWEMVVSQFFWAALYCAHYYVWIKPLFVNLMTYVLGA